MAEQEECPFYALTSPEQSRPAVRIVVEKTRAPDREEEEEEETSSQPAAEGEESKEGESKEGKGGGPQPPLQLVWEEGKDAPCALYKGAITLHDGVVFCSSLGSDIIHKYTLYDRQWVTLPQCPTASFALAVVRGLLTAVGGETSGDRGERYPSNSLFSFHGEESSTGSWDICYPAMPTKRSYSSAVCYQDALVVIGGHTDYIERTHCLATVEVMNIHTLVWFTAPSLPWPSRSPSTALGGSVLYLLGGWDDSGSRVLRGDLDLLRRSCRPLSTISSRSRTGGPWSTVWETVESPPVHSSSCGILEGQLIALGGKGERGKVSDEVYAYCPSDGGYSWRETGHLPGGPLFHCLAASAGEGEGGVVVGGLRRGGVACCGTWTVRLKKTATPTTPDQEMAVPRDVESES